VFVKFSSDNNFQESFVTICGFNLKGGVGREKGMCGKTISRRYLCIIGQVKTFQAGIGLWK
jgi:hypothetical protein